MKGLFKESLHERTTQEKLGASRPCNSGNPLPYLELKGTRGGNTVIKAQGEQN